MKQLLSAVLTLFFLGSPAVSPAISQADLSDSIYTALRGEQWETARIRIRASGNPTRLSTPVMHYHFAGSPALEDNLLCISLKSKNILPLVLEEGADPNALTYDGTLLSDMLLSNIYYFTLPKLELLFEYGLDLETKDRAGNTALIYAIQSNQYEFVDWMLQHGASIDDKAIQTAIEECLLEPSRVFSSSIDSDSIVSQVAILARVAQNQLDSPERSREFYQRLIQAATQYPSAELVSLQAIVTAAFGSAAELKEYLPANSEGRSLLTSVACAAGNVDTLKYLCEQSAPASNLLGLSISFGQDACTEYLLSIPLAPRFLPWDSPPVLYNIIPDSMAALARYGTAEEMQRLIDAGYPMTEESVNYALAFAVYCKNYDILRALHEMGYSLQGGNTTRGEFLSLPEACASGDIELVRLLLESGVDPNCGDPLNYLITYSGRSSDVDIMNLLLEYGASIIATSDYGPLFDAVNYDRPDLADILLKHGAEVSDDAVLLSACGSLRLMKMMLDARPDFNINIQNAQGETMLIKAVQFGQAANVQYLLSLGADVSLQDEWGHAAEWFVKEYENPLIQALFAKYTD